MTNISKWALNHKSALIFAAASFGLGAPAALCADGHASCAVAICEPGYHCELDQSGKPGCYRNGSGPGPSHPTCEGAVCPVGYECYISNGAARCRKTFEMFEGQ